MVENLPVDDTLLFYKMFLDYGSNFMYATAAHWLALYEYDLVDIYRQLAFTARTLSIRLWAINPNLSLRVTRPQRGPILCKKKDLFLPSLTALFRMPTSFPRNPFKSPWRCGNWTSQCWSCLAGLSGLFKGPRRKMFSVCPYPHMHDTMRIWNAGRNFFSQRAMYHVPHVVGHGEWLNGVASSRSSAAKQGTKRGEYW